VKINNKYGERQVIPMKSKSKKTTTISTGVHYRKSIRLNAMLNVALLALIMGFAVLPAWTTIMNYYAIINHSSALKCGLGYFYGWF
jgi:hypothetical protein